MIRIILAGLWAVLFLIVSMPLMLIEFLIGLKWPKARAASSQWIVKTFGFRPIVFFSGTKVIVKGADKVPKDRAVLVVPNHRSIFDIVVGYIYMPIQVGYVAKKEIQKVPLLNIWMALMNCQFLDRKDLRAGLKVILKCADLIKSGSSVCIFPEGTRNKGTDDIQEFRDGSLKIAEKAECPVVPLAINNTDQILEAHMPFVKRATVVFEFCDPIESAGLSREEKKKLSSRAQDEILAAYRNNKELCVRK